MVPANHLFAGGPREKFKKEAPAGAGSRIVGRDSNNGSETNQLQQSRRLAPSRPLGRILIAGAGGVAEVEDRTSAPSEPETNDRERR